MKKPICRLCGHEINGIQYDLRSVVTKKVHCVTQESYEDLKSICTICYDKIEKSITTTILSIKEDK